MWPSLLWMMAVSLKLSALALPATAVASTRMDGTAE
jgi:hypothetical protein